jgi:hypothetical protein
MKRKPLKLKSDVAELLITIAEEAETGDIVGVFVVMQGNGGSYNEAYLCDDMDEMLLEVGSAKIRARIELERERQQASKS